MAGKENSSAMVAKMQRNNVGSCFVLQKDCPSEP